MQLGYHFKQTDGNDIDDKDTTIAYPSRVLRKDLDRPVIIYPNPDDNVPGKFGILIAYCSGIVSRWSFQAVHQEAEEGERGAIEDIQLSRISSIDISNIYSDRYCFMNPHDVQLGEESCLPEIPGQYYDDDFGSLRF